MNVRLEKRESEKFLSSKFEANLEIQFLFNGPN